jgi:glutathione-regulated potassium-efflux system ancillary protein KefG
MAKVLLLFAHPAFEKSRVNRALVKAAKRVAGVTFHDLYQHYPDFDVDPEREQRLLSEHDAVILQHPFYWYSTPALVKQWFDLVLEHGWAYGEGGVALAGKRLISVITMGGRETAYTPEGFHQITIPELLAPIRQTARLCGMDYTRPYVIHGAFQLGQTELSHVERDYAEFLEALVHNRVDFTQPFPHDAARGSQKPAASDSPQTNPPTATKAL